MTNTGILSAPKSDSSIGKLYSGLPDEEAISKIAKLHECAKACNQPFRLELFDRHKHQRALCVALTNSGDDSIAVFYVSESGLYAWTKKNRLHVLPPAMSGSWAEIPLELGTLYWFTLSTIGHKHAKAESMGSASNLKEQYLALNTPPVSKSANKKSKLSDDDSNGAPPALRPNDNLCFTPFDSLDSLGL